MNSTDSAAMSGARMAARAGGVPAVQPAGPRYFPLSAREEAAAEAWLEENTTHACCQMRTAGSLILLREGNDGLEVFLTFRAAPEAAIGSVGFPGGVAQPEDDQPIGWFGPTPAQWAQKLGQEELLGGRRAVVSAIRGGFEEVGVLLAGPDDSTTAENSEASETMASREQIAAHDLDFAGYLKRAGLKLRTDLLKPLGRWQSPDFSHRRYDAHYFAAVVPVGQKPKMLASRGAWGRWVSARELVRDLDSTDLGAEIGAEKSVGHTVQELLTPGVLCILESVAASHTTISFLTKKRTVHTQKPELREHEGDLRLCFTAPRDGCGARAKGV